MSERFNITLEDLQAVVFPEVLARGVAYWEGGHVLSGFVSDGILAANVMGTMGDYRVSVFWKDGRLSSRCECPYKQDFCKHAAAVAWGWLNESERFVTSEDLLQKIERLSRDRMIQVFIQLASQDPRHVLEALSMEHASRSSPLAVERLSENMTKGEVGSPEWLTAWRRILALLADEPFNEHKKAWNQLIHYGLTYLQKGESTPEDFWDCFKQAIKAWGNHEECNDSSLPEWWEEFIALYQSSGDAQRRRLEVILIDSLDETSRRLLRIMLEENSAEDWSLIGLKVGLALKDGLDLHPMLQKTLEDFDHTLALLDAFSNWEAWNWLKRLAQSGLRHCSSENKLIFRERLALAHIQSGEPRQALALLLANFKERPGWGEYLEIIEAAKAAREGERVSKEIQNALTVGKRWELLARVLIHEEDWTALEEVSSFLQPESPWVTEAANRLCHNHPRSAKELFEKKIRYLFGLGTRRAVREAIPCLTELKKLCKHEGWREEWETFRLAFVDEITDPIALRMTGSLLEEEAWDEKPILAVKGD